MLAVGPDRAAVIGSPIGHSKSPALHAAAYRLLGVDCSYTALEVDAHSIGGFVDELRSTAGWRGVSVTMPLKAAVVPLVDEVADLAVLLGVANTVVVSSPAEPGQGAAQGERVSAGRMLTAHNTDVAGISRALGDAGAVRPQAPLILGGGGTAAAAVAGLADLGASTVRFAVRRPEAAADLVRIAAALGLTVEVAPWEHAGALLRQADVVVSTLPPRAADGIAADLRGTPAFHTEGVLLDVAYDPWPSDLAAAWDTAGGTVVAGIEMLLHQAVEQVRLFFPERRQDPALVLAAMREALGVTRR